MLKLRALIMTGLLFVCLSGSALAEGFAMTEWSARGLALGGGMIGRADDVSALAYNAAGITQLPGTHMMVGFSLIAPYGTVYNGAGQSESAIPNEWLPGHGYISHQLNDNVWLGFGLFSRFGLGNAYDENWFGNNSVMGVGLTTVSAVPTVAYKFNDMFSASLGVEIMYASIFMDQRTNNPFTGDYLNTTSLNADGVGFGIHAGLHAKFNDQWSAGLTYKSQVKLDLTGSGNFAHQISSLGPVYLGMVDTGIDGSITLPDSISFGIAYKPLDNLSFEVGTVFTRWSTYNSLDIHFNSGISSINPKKWKDGWNFNASVEYSPLDWLTLRAGYWHETSVVDAQYTDYLMPTNGRDVLTLGVGMHWDNWTVDVAYAHLWIYDTDFSQSLSHGVAGQGGNSSNVGAHIVSLSVGYSF